MQWPVTCRTARSADPTDPVKVKQQHDTRAKKTQHIILFYFWLPQERMRKWYRKVAKCSLYQAHIRTEPDELKTEEFESFFCQAGSPKDIA